MSDQEKICRLCLKCDKFSISIFSNYVKEKNIRSNIEEYLRIQINRSDKVTKYICYQCLSHLDFIKKFVKTAKQSQIILQDDNNSSESLFSENSFQTPPPVEQNNVEAKRKCGYIDSSEATQTIESISKGKFYKLYKFI